MTVRPGLWANTPTNIGVALESDLANFGVAIRAFPSGVPCYAEDTQTFYIWDPQDTTSPSVVGQTVAVFVNGVQVGTWHAVGGGTVLTAALDTVVGATDSLKSTIPTVNGVTASVKGYYAAGDGGSAPLYYWSALYAGAANDGTIVRPTAAVVGAWFAIFSGPINVLWFGAKGDGVTDDTAAINAALAAVPVTGGGCNFPGNLVSGIARTFLITTLITVTGYTDLKFFSDSGAKIQQTKNIRGFDFDTCTNLEISGIHLLGTIQVDGGNPGGGNENQTGIRLVSCTGVNIHNNVFENQGGYGIFVHVSNADVNIHDNQFIETMAGCQGGSGIFNYLWVTDNFFLGYPGNAGLGYLGSDDMIGFFGSTLGGTSGQVIINRNIIDKQGPSTQNQARCIDVTTNGVAGGDLFDIEICDNICINCITTDVTRDRAAIIISGGAGVAFQSLQVCRNQIRNCNEGIQLDERGIEEVAIDDNIITDVVRLAGGVTIPCAIRVVTAVGGEKRGSISGNIIQRVGGAAGGTIAALHVDTVSNFRINDNVIDDVDDMGIFVTGFSDVDLSHNTVSNADTYGIFVFNGSNIRASDNEVAITASHGFQIVAVTDGIFNSNRTRNTTISGFLLQSNTNVTVSDNDCSASSLYGIVEVAGNTGLIIANNNCHNNTNYGISLQGTNSNGLIEGNRLVGNGVAPLQNVSITSRWWFTDNMELNAIAGGIVGNNRGQAVIADAAVAVAVVFPVAEPDANYLINISAFPSAGAAATSENVFWNAKVAGGFTINTRLAPGAGQTVTIDWEIIR